MTACKMCCVLTAPLRQTKRHAGGAPKQIGTANKKTRLSFKAALLSWWCSLVGLMKEATVAAATAAVLATPKRLSDTPVMSAAPHAARGLLTSHEKVPNRDADALTYVTKATSNNPWS